MKLSKNIWALFQKDLLLEIRQQYTFYGILLYISATSFVVYLAAGQPEDKIWNALFWILQLFICINAVAKSFLQESKERMLYYYTISSPTAFVISKLLFNAVLMLVMNLVSLAIFTLLLGNPLTHFFTFLGISLLGSISLSLLFTFLAAIAAKAQQQTALMAIMGFPLIIPQLLLLMKIAVIAFSSVVQNGMTELVAMLIGLDVLVIALAYILFPFLWKD
jgi:heme exporter protein B